MKRKILATSISAVIGLAVLSACSVNNEKEATIETSPPVASAERPQENEATVQQRSVVEEVATLDQPRQASTDREQLLDLVEERKIAGSAQQQPQVTAASRLNYNLIQPGQESYFIPPGSRENYASLDDNRIKRVTDEPVSTFSIDVDTASYSNVRRFLNEGRLPPADAVRTEEMVNYFAYNYPRDSNEGAPFSVYSEISASPWSANKHLLHIGVQAVEADSVQDLPANLVFLVDVSGSMNSPDKLGLLQSSLKMLTRQLDEHDRVSLVVYAGASGVVLEPTPGNQEHRIVSALERLRAGGSTNGAAGIELAYHLAQRAYIDGGINRVILATDGDFNVGASSVQALKDMIVEKRKTGISLTTLGFGTGNTNDHMMEQLADNGNGNYAYIDTLNEARKVLVDEMSSTLHTVAKDVKVQIEFNPAVVAEYRLVGYENRLLNREDFNNDKIDAGEIGAGHTVTALYEISLAGSRGQSVEPLRYRDNQPGTQPVAVDTSEFAFLKLRYKAPEEDSSTLIEQPLLVADIRDSITDTSEDYRFSAAVAGFAQLLKQDASLGSFSFDDVLVLAQPARGDDIFGYRAEFINMVRTASALR